ncbi:MAG: DUF427 domain-containing protein [Pacificimonas sp.]|jgi:uncharacterized protein (DUF427 family)|nr:DUF427 domain-containing protein [Pacificimonas sp.]
MDDLPDKAAMLARARPHRAAWLGARRPAAIEKPGPGQESVWDYPRPPLIRPAPGPILVKAGGRVVAETNQALEVIETASAPVPYIPPTDIDMSLLDPGPVTSVCEWKGAARTFDVAVPHVTRIADAAWCYPDPFDDLAEGYAEIAGWLAFYPGRIECYLDGERVQPQPGGFYGGWVTARLTGPIKGAPGSSGW